MLKNFRRRFIVLNMMLITVVLLAAFILAGFAIYRNDYAELRNTMSLVLRPWNASDEKHRSELEKQKRENQSSQNEIAEKNKSPRNTQSEKKENSESNRAGSKEKPSSKPDSTKANDNKSNEGADAPDNKPDGDKAPENEPHNGAGTPDNNKPDSGNKPTDTNPDRKRHDNITTVFYYPQEDRITVISESLSFDGDVEMIVREVIDSKESFGVLKNRNVIYYKEKTDDVYKLALTDVSYISTHMVRIIIILSAAFVFALGIFLLISIRLSRFAAKPMENAIEMERKFVADISHDLKTPITVILANNSILKSDEDAKIGDNMQWIDSTDSAAEDMMNLITEMLTMSSLDNEEKVLQKEPVNLTAVAERSILQFESVAYEKNVTLEDDIAEGLTIRATEEYTKRICSSLLENALKYEPKNGKIILKAFAGKKKAFFVVHNCSSYIASEDLPHIFDRFYRGDKTRQLHSGHGLGLPIIKQMTKLIDADISVESSKETGTVFSVMFNIV